METQPPQGIDIQQIADIILRRKAIVVSCILTALTLGLPAYLNQPKIYQGTALLSYQQQSINPTQMSPDQRKNIRNIVSTLSEIVQSRTKLEKIVTNEDLYLGMRENLPMEDVVVNMRKHITIQPSRGGDTFTVTYDSTDREKVARVTNALASGFIEENLKYREEKATDTSAYTQDELNMAKEILDKKEALMRDYKLKHYNEMPGQRDVNMSRLSSLQEQYQNRQESIQELERTRAIVRDQIRAQKEQIRAQEQILAELFSRDSANTNLSEQTLQIEPNQASLQRLRENLKILRQRYTDQHPKIISLKKRIKFLEENTSDTTETFDDTTEISKQNLDSTLFELPTEITQIPSEIERIEMNIRQIKEEKDELSNLIKQYQGWIAAVPVREAEWSALTREYDQLKRHYDFLVSRNLQAGSALNLERKQKGSQFKIIDPAKRPNKPTTPDFIKFMGMAFFAGAALAGGIIVALEFFNSTYRSPAKLTQTFDIEVICSVPQISLKRELTRSRVKAAIGVFFFICWGVSLIFAMYWLKQQNMIIL